MKRNIFRTVISLLTIFTILLCACSSEETAPTQTPVTTPSDTSTPQADWWDEFGEPQYGGTLTVLIDSNGGFSLDPLICFADNHWAESLYSRNWTVDRSICDFKTEFVPLDYYEGMLAESWEQKDPTTYILHLREGVTWQDKPPVNGRELTADDIKYNFDRLIGKGDFTEPNPSAAAWAPNVESVEAIDKYTLQFNMKQGAYWGLYEVLNGGFAGLNIIPPESIQQNLLEDWHDAIGSGPWILSDYVSGVETGYSRNPDYWGYDQRYPQNQLPYADTLKLLVIPDPSTAVSALRTGKIDAILEQNFISLQQASTIMETDPDINQDHWPSTGQSLVMRVDKSPFGDVKVRTALQMAVDLDSIARYHYEGYVDGVPCGVTYPGFEGWCLPYDEWPADLQKEYTYDPEAARQLLAEAGYPEGFDTNIVAAGTAQDIELLEIVKANFADIGVQMDIELLSDFFAWMQYTGAGKHDQMSFANTVGKTTTPNASATQFMPGYRGNTTYNDDPEFTALVGKALSAASEGEAKQYCTEVDMYVLGEHWAINLTPTVSPVFWQPWVKGYSGELCIGSLCEDYWARFWIDQDTKTSMGY